MTIAATGVAQQIATQQALTSPGGIADPQRQAVAAQQQAQQQEVPAQGTQIGQTSDASTNNDGTFGNGASLQAAAQEVLDSGADITRGSVLNVFA